jgi:hypothetical protein
MKAATPVALGAALLIVGIWNSQGAAASRHGKARAPLPTPALAKIVQSAADRFMGCDIRVRDYLREGGAVVQVKKIDVDDTRLQLSVQHEYGDAGKTSRIRLRGDSEEEMRNDLRVWLQEFAAAVTAAVAGHAVIAPRKVMNVSEIRNGSAENTSPWVAVVLADIQSRCRPVAFYTSVDRDKLDPELSKKLDE